ncbi:PD-(D/E)XK nuclease family protein [Acinetobacter modestus]|uniref:PDDEXK-like family protein n=1 Tax=Acinetobacter modestus TaxID=1776740 RepID=UPI00202E379D|nr:PD-(D/E)XK nuclease family protein [Acinetobacter modestus]MCM1960590.1 PD-(D/E)XK nuclease family protein [Acinetobacter modestus]
MDINNFSSQLSSFFAGWKNIDESKNNDSLDHKFLENLDLFFQEWGKLPVIEKVEEKPLYVDSNKLKIFFNRFDDALEPIREARKKGLSVNVWRAAGVGENEVRNSQVLKWLLDYRGDHGQGNKILVELLKLLELLPQRFQNYSLERYSTIAECCPLGNQDNRIDIEIDAPDFLLFIEIKINAGEGKDQLQRYIDIANAKAKGRDWMIVYLTRDGKLPEKYKLYKEQERLIGLSWKKLAEIFYGYAKDRDVNNRSVWLVSQFADHVKSF